MQSPPAVMRDKFGFTLLEAIIATLILSLTMLWTMQSVLSAYNYTSRNQIRDEAVRLADEILTDFRNTPFNNLVAGTSSVDIDRQVRSYDVTFTTDRDVQSALGGLANSVEVKINWSHGGQNYDYTVSTVIGNK